MSRFHCVRKTYVVVGVLQLIAVIERQVFDFMGYMWLCIAFNFLHVICVILGTFGAIQHRSCYVIFGIVWNLLWVGWNAFIVCLYMNFGILRKEMPILNLGTGTPNWWYTNGPGCTATYNFSTVDPTTFRAKIVRVDNCLLDHEYIEVAHSALEVLLSILAIIFGIILAHLYRGKDSCTLTDAAHSKAVPGYSLSLQPSVLDRGESFGDSSITTGPRDSAYDTVPRTVPSLRPQVYGTTQSDKFPSMSNRRSTASRNTRSSLHSGTVPKKNGFDSIRASTRRPSKRKGDVENGGFGSEAESADSISPRRSVHPAIRPHPLYAPGSVSPYHGRGGVEASF